ncbi:hypothetical protein [Nocardioides sp. P5_E3]
MRTSLLRLGTGWAIALTGALVVTPAHATTHEERPAADTRVSPARYPNVEEVARIFAVYRGGRREFLGGRQLSLTSADCQYLDLADTQPRAGRVANYIARRGGDPFFTGGTSVGVALYDFRKPKRAQTALDEQRDTISSCYGPNFDGDGYGNTYRRLAAPNLADDQFAYRQINHDVNTGNDWFNYVYFRQGRFLGIASLQRDRSAPSASAAFDLARAAVRSAT